MATNDIKTISNTSGIPMSEEELKECEQCFIDMEENIKHVYKYGEDYGTVNKNELESKKTTSKSHKSSK